MAKPKNPDGRTNTFNIRSADVLIALMMALIVVFAAKEYQSDTTGGLKESVRSDRALLTDKFTVPEFEAVAVTIVLPSGIDQLLKKHNFKDSYGEPVVAQDIFWYFPCCGSRGSLVKAQYDNMKAALQKFVDNDGGSGKLGVTTIQGAFGVDEVMAKNIITQNGRLNADIPRSQRFISPEKFIWIPEFMKLWVEQQKEVGIFKKD